MFVKRQKVHGLQTSIKKRFKSILGRKKFKFGKRQNKLSDKISTEQWSQHFKAVFRTSESRVNPADSDNGGDDSMCINNRRGSEYSNF